MFDVVSENSVTFARIMKREIFVLKTHAYNDIKESLG